MPRIIIKRNHKNSIDVVRYIIYKYNFDGEPITNLKLQKILYYVYVWQLVKNHKICFNEKFQAWPIGPVLYSVYKELRKFGSSPVPSTITKIKNEKDVDNLKKVLGNELVDIIDWIYEKYGQLTAFQLVMITHNESPWLNARRGLNPTETSTDIISDEDIIQYYSKIDE